MDSCQPPNIRDRHCFTAKKLRIFVVIIILVAYIFGVLFIQLPESRIKHRQPKACKSPCSFPTGPAADGTTAKAASGGADNQSTSSHLGCSKKTILIWTAFFSDPLENLFKNQYLEKCACGSSCRISSDKALIEEAVVVLFHARDIDFTALPTYRTASQLWIIFNLESPVYASINQRYDDTFNLTMTYRRDSDIVMPYAHYEPSRKGAPISSSATKGLARRRPVYWLVNNCVQPRMDYALELGKHIEVDIFGGCSGRTTCPRDDPCESSLSSSYAFYLSFENSNCPDYITEKLWKVLQSPGGAIPVVMGAPMSDYKATAPPESFIHVDNFTSPRELAAYLKKVMSSTDLFSYYHQWREAYSVMGEEAEFTTCKLCDVAQGGAKSSDKGRRVSAWFNQGCLQSHSSRFSFRTSILLALLMQQKWITLFNSG